MSKIKLFIHNPGDPSVGLWPIDAVVTIEDNLIWSEEQIQELKEFYAETYDTRVSNVRTEKENLEDTIGDLQHELSMLNADMSVDSYTDKEFENMKKSEEFLKNKIKEYQEQLKTISSL